MHSASPSVFWLPAKHNDKTFESFKKTQNLYQDREAAFKLDSQKRLEDRLKLYDEKLEELPKKKSFMASEKVAVE